MSKKLVEQEFDISVFDSFDQNLMAFDLDWAVNVTLEKVSRGCHFRRRLPELDNFRGLIVQIRTLFRPCFGLVELCQIEGFSNLFLKLLHRGVDRPIDFQGANV